MFTAASFTIDKSWKQPKSPLTDEWTKKLLYICTVEYYSALKSKEVLTHVTTWMNFEGVMLSEISQSQKSTYYMNPPM